MKKKLIESTEPVAATKKGWQTRAQVIGEYLVLDAWFNRELQFRHTINTETYEYATFRPGGTWGREQLAGAFGLTYYKNTYWHSDTFLDEGEKKLIIPVKDRTILHMALGEKFAREYACKYSRKSILRAIDVIEQDYDRKKRQAAEDRRWQRVKSEMEKIPEPPVAGLKEWLDQSITGGQSYLFKVPDKKEKPYDWRCSACGKVTNDKVILFNRDGEKYKDGDRITCPKCGENVLIMTRKKSIDVQQPFMLIENLDDTTSVARHFRSRLICDGRGRKRIAIAEDIRLMMYREPYGRKGIRFDLYYEQSYNGSGAWYDSDEWQPGCFDNKSNPYQKRERTGLLYPEGIEDGLKGTIYEDWIRTFTAAAQKGVRADYNRLMCTCMNEPNTMPDLEEMMLKGRFYRLFREISEDISLWDYQYAYDHEYSWPLGRGGVCTYGENIEEIFAIEDRQLINRIRDNDGGGLMLEWMRWSQRHGRKVSDKVLGWAAKNKLCPTDQKMNWLLCCFSPEQAMNYIERQRKEQYEGKSVSVVIEQYNDYMEMCKKLKKDIADAMVYRPRELKRRHDEAVADVERLSVKIEAAQYAKKFPEAEKVLKKIRSKFKYRGEKYFIKVPRHIADIVVEGRCLHHCAGATDRYFDRIKEHETYICFLRRTESPDTPFYTIEVEPGGTIRQHRGIYDEEPDIEKIKPFLREWQKVIKGRMDAEDKKKAKISKKKRAENIEELKAKNNTRVLEGLMQDFMDAAAV